MKKYILILPLITLLSVACNNKSFDTQVGQTLPAWSEGCLDIHFVNSGKGECCFYILPDGTTLLVDAGEVIDKNKGVAQRPNRETRPYITYTKYIKHFLPNGAEAIDYCLPTHLHTDHIGSSANVSGVSPAGYRKSGLTAIYDQIAYKHILDRAYPTYTEDSVTPKLEGQLSKDWATFVTWGVKEGKFTADRFTAGKEQIVMLNNAEKYNNFSILNICANGFVVGKDKEGNTAVLGSKQKSGGNSSSCGFHINYGNFDYIACGDLVGSPQNRLAYYFRDFIGDGNLDAFKCNHHLAGNSWGTQMQQCNFNPRIILNHCFTNNKPHVDRLKHVLTFTEGFYATNIHPDIFVNEDVKANKLIDKMTAFDGHVVLRVAPGGDKFYVYMLDDGDFEYRVKSIHGPYTSR